MKSLSLLFVIAIIGAIFLVGGVAAAVNRTMSTATCEACGMEVNKEDVSTFSVVTADGEDHWACCPVCADVVGLYYKDCEIQGQCFACGKQIDVHLNNGQLSYLDFSGNKEFIKVLLGGACEKNKLVCSGTCATSVHQSYEWAENVPEKNLQESLLVSNNKLQTMTVGYKPVSIPSLNYALIGIGVALVAVAPIAWKLANKNPKTPKPNPNA